MADLCVGNSIECEIAKTLLSLASAGVIGLVTYWVVNVYVDKRDRRRDAADRQGDKDLQDIDRKRAEDESLRREFFAMYGEFRTVWKLWKDHLDGPKTPERRNQLLESACEAEGKMEAALLRIVSEKTLTGNRADRLGLFRQAYQQLRESIKKDQPLPYFDSAHPAYQAFKTLTIEATNNILVPTDPPKHMQSIKTFQWITDNVFEGYWRSIVEQGTDLKTALEELEKVRKQRSGSSW